MSAEGIKEFEAEVDTIIRILSSGRETKIDLARFMDECSLLFDKIDNVMREGDTREKDLVYRKLKDLSSDLDNDIQSLCKQIGKTEEEISAYIENPDSYSQEDWSAIQKTRRRILKKR